MSYQSFIGGVQGNLELLISEVKNISFTGLPITTNKKVFKKRAKKRH
ncbi:hypothetical protein FM109_06315 [Vibrio casei]|nr:hypothetical protein FM109_06315 [Vibrio casei]